MSTARTLKILLATITCSLLSVIALAADEVRLKHAEFTPYFENGFDFAELEGAIEVQNLGANKQVWVHYQTGDGQWLDHPAYYVGPTFNGYEAFTFRLPLMGEVSQLQLAIKYDVNGQTYWDNNQDQDYTFDSDRQTAFMYQSVALDDAVRDFTSVNVKVRAKHSSTEQVFIVYSADNWAHQERRALTLNQTVSDESGLSGIWNGQVIVEYYQPFEFYLEYQDGGVTEVANYYGKNFKLINRGTQLGTSSALQKYPAVYFRGSTTLWKPLTMQLSGDYQWQTAIYFDGLQDFKFDMHADWSRNFGDNNDDGVADEDGANITSSYYASTLIEFNSLTKEYSITPLY